MWNDKRSLTLSTCCTLLFMAMLIAAVILAPRLVGYLMYLSPSAKSAGEMLFLLTVYAGCLPAAILLVSLYSLLRRVGAGRVFVHENTVCLRCISWCCFAGAVICGASAVYYIPWAAVAVAAAFMGLILRVLRNVIAKAVSLQDEAEFTV